MKWSFRLGTVSGIGVYIHATFFILIGWIFLVHWLEGYNAWEALEGVAFILSIFACVLLHEFGHSLMARRFNIKTRDITLLPIGGLARLAGRPEESGWQARPHGASRHPQRAFVGSRPRAHGGDARWAARRGAIRAGRAGSAASASAPAASRPRCGTCRSTAPASAACSR